MPRGRGREVGRHSSGVAPATLIWSAVLLIAPFLDLPASAALPWGLGAVLLIGVFPTVLVTYLRRHNDIRRPPLSSLPPAVLGGAALAFMFQRIVLWLNGPLALSAAVFALLAVTLVLLVASSFTNWSWLDLTLGAGTVIITLAASLLFGLVLAGPLTIMAAILVTVRTLTIPGPQNLIATGIGVVTGGGVFFWLLKVASP